VEGLDIASVLLRLGIGGTILAHGPNHAFGGGKLPGTARWFASIGMRPAKVHALLATVTEIGAAVLLLLGFLTPLAAAGVVGTMTVALIANHLKNGFFIFRPGEGYEYVLMIIVVSLAIGALGGGEVSIDHAFDLDVDLDGWVGTGIAAAGAVAAAVVLATSWRPTKR